jgi:hypothetical protein
MNNCSGVHCPGCRGSGSIGAAIAAVALVVAAVMRYRAAITETLWVTAVVLGSAGVLAFAGTAAVVIILARRSRPTWADSADVTSLITARPSDCLPPDRADRAIEAPKSLGIPADRIHHGQGRR